MDKFMHASGSELLMEAIPESLKNMLLVMETAGVFDPPSDGTVQDVSRRFLIHILERDIRRYCKYFGHARDMLETYTPVKN